MDNLTVINQLCEQLAGKEHWQEVTDSTWLAKANPGQRLLTRSDGLAVLTARDVLSREAVKSEVHRWVESLKAIEVPTSWSDIFVLFVLSGKLPDELSTSLESLKETSADGKQVVAAGFVGLDGRRIALPSRPMISTRSIASALPELAETAPPPQRRVVDWFAAVEDMQKMQPWVTWTLVAACCIVFLLTWGGGQGLDNRVLLRYGANFGPMTWQGEWWRLVGSTFLHGGVLHLLVNMYFLMIVGPTIERMFGHLRYAALYAVSGVCGSVLSALHGPVVSVGASGALFGLCGAALVLGYRYKKDIPVSFRQRLIRSMLQIVGYNLLFGFMAPGMHIDNSAHIGGLLGGAVFTLFVSPQFRHAVFRPMIVSTLAIALIVLGFGGTEAYVLARASKLIIGPSSLYQEPAGRYSFNYPAGVQLEMEQGNPVLQSPGVCFVFCEVLQLEKPRTMDALIRDVDQVMALDKSMEVKDHHTESMGANRWYVVRAASREADQGRLIAYMPHGREAFRVRVHYLATEESETQAILTQVLTTFKPLKPAP